MRTPTPNRTFKYSRYFHSGVQFISGLREDNSSEGDRVDENLAKAGIDLTSQASEFVVQVTPTQEIRETFGDGVRLWRWKRSVRMLERATKFARERGIAPGEIPTSVLFPLLELAANEDNDEMTDRWAYLLMSAAGDPTTIPPSYPRMLSELSRTDVRVLDLAYDFVITDPLEPDRFPWSRGVAFSDLSSELDLRTEPLTLTLFNLMRFKLMEPETEGNNVTLMTHLGIHFTSVCKGIDPPWIINNPKWTGQETSEADSDPPSHDEPRGWGLTQARIRGDEIIIPANGKQMRS